MASLWTAIINYPFPARCFLSRSQKATEYCVIRAYFTHKCTHTHTQSPNQNSHMTLSRFNPTEIFGTNLPLYSLAAVQLSYSLAALSPFCNWELCEDECTNISCRFSQATCLYKVRQSFRVRYDEAESTLPGDGGKKWYSRFKQKHGKLWLCRGQSYPWSSTSKI